MESLPSIIKHVMGVMVSQQFNPGSPVFGHRRLSYDEY